MSVLGVRATGYTVLRESFVIRYPDLPRQRPQPDAVLTTVIPPTVHHVSAATTLTHYSATAPPGEAATAASLSNAFGL